MKEKAQTADPCLPPDRAGNTAQAPQTDPAVETAPPDRSKPRDHLLNPMVSTQPPFQPPPLPLSRVAIQSRRYLGAKTRLLDFLDTTIRNCCGAFTSFADVFGGTGVVADRFNQLGVRILANDILSTNVVPLRCFLETTDQDMDRIERLIQALGRLEPEEENYFSLHFGGKYFTRENAIRIGTIRETISSWRSEAYISRTEEIVLLTSLLYAVDRIANTCGHYDAYRMKLDCATPLNLAVPRIDQAANQGNRVYQKDANLLVREIDVDVLYLDPPYNSRQYSDTYHLLENLIRWEKPPVFGKARKMDRKTLKSAYCSEVRAARTFADLIDNARCRHIVFSYNNMAQKGDRRSNACVPDDAIEEILERRGTVSVHEVPFNHFSAGLREIESHSERLFICQVRR